MRGSRFESEIPQLLRIENSLEVVHTKNVIELSVLHREEAAKRSRSCMNEQSFDENRKTIPRSCSGIEGSD